MNRISSCSPFVCTLFVCYVIISFPTLCLGYEFCHVNNFYSIAFNDNKGSYLNVLHVPFLISCHLISRIHGCSYDNSIVCSQFVVYLVDAVILFVLHNLIMLSSTDTSASFSHNMEDEYEKFVRRMNPPMYAYICFLI